MSDPVPVTTDPEASLGEHWMPKRGRFGMWRTVLETSAAGVTWTTSRGDKGFTPWETWRKRWKPAT